MPPTGTILVVDANRDDIALLLGTFKQLGVENPVHICESADTAVEFLETHPLPAVMLVDIRMPDKDGFYVLNKVKSHPEWKDLVVIVSTTSCDTGDIRLAYELGANSFLTKPFDLDEFRQMVNAFHQYWVIQNQPTPKRGGLRKPPALTAF